MPNTIHEVVTGKDEDPARSIDENLKVMGLIFALVDAFPVSSKDQSNVEVQKSVVNMTMIGAADPSIVGGAIVRKTDEK